MPRKGFPQIASMPSIRKNTSLQCNDIPMRSIETENLNSLEATTSPYSARLPEAETNHLRKWKSISASSESSSGEENENEKMYQSSQAIKTASISPDFQKPAVMEKESSMLELSRSSLLKPERIVNKGGDRNVSSKNIPEKSRLFLKDIVHTLIEAKWRWVLAVYVLTYFTSWLCFSILYYIIGWAHGDLDFDAETGQRLSEGHDQCIRGALAFSGFFLLSVESQVSTGYGTWYPTEECGEALFVLIVQLMIGVIIDASMVGVVYVKIIRPPKHSEFKFCRNAVICQRDGQMCLIFRVADFMQEHSIDSKIRAYLFEEKITLEGERIKKSQQRLKLENNGRVFLIWPNTVCHPIDKSSPFYDMSAKDLVEKSFEVVLSLTGISRHTGQTTQVRTSYMSTEIFWGYRFVNVISYDRKAGQYVTNIDNLEYIEQVDTALCSAQRLDELLEDVHAVLEPGTSNSYQIDDIAETEDEQEDDTISGLHMKPTEPATTPRKFNVTKIFEASE